jgi:hypothetical protein
MTRCVPTPCPERGALTELRECQVDHNDGAGEPAGLPTQRHETVATASPSVSQRPYSFFAWLRRSSLLKFYNLDTVNTKTLI